MENFAEVKERILNSMIENGINKYDIERVENCESWDKIQEFIADNIHWWFKKDIDLPDGHYKSNLCEFTVVNDKQDGEFKSWWEDGQLAVHCTFKDGLLNGEYEYWWSNSQMYVQSSYINGKYYHYDESGKLIVKEYYTKGKINKFRTFIFKYFNI